MGRVALATLVAIALVLGTWSVGDPGDRDDDGAPQRGAVVSETVVAPTTAEVPTPTTTPAPTTTTSVAAEVPEIDVRAAAWVVADTDGRVLVGEAVDVRRPIASLAKLPLALVTLDALVAETTHTVPGAAATVRGRRVGWTAATEVPTAELLDGLLRTSGNDAAVTAASAVGGDDVALRAISAAGGDGIADVAGLRSDTVASPGEVAGWLAEVLAEPVLREPLERRALEPLPGQGDTLLVGERVPRFVAVKTSWSPAAGRGLAALMRFGDEERLVVVLDATDPAQAAIDAYVLAWFTERARSSELAAAAGRGSTVGE